MAVGSMPFSKIPRETYRSHFCLSILRSRDKKSGRAVSGAVIAIRAFSRRGGPFPL